MQINAKGVRFMYAAKLFTNKTPIGKETGNVCKTRKPMVNRNQEPNQNTKKL